MIAAIVLWNTVYLEKAVEHLKQQGLDIPEEYLQHLSPLGWEHINLTGDYPSFVTLRKHLPFLNSRAFV